jgi:hypothetical protein
MKAPAKSVPPEMLHHQMSGTSQLLELRVPQRCTSSDSGEPVVPSARTLRSPGMRRQVDAGLHAVGEEGGAGAEEGDAQVGGEAPQRVQSGAPLVPAGLPS